MEIQKNEMKNNKVHTDSEPGEEQCSHRLMVRTLGFQPRNAGSVPAGSTNDIHMRSSYLYSSLSLLSSAGVAPLYR